MSVLPTITAPAAFSRLTTSASSRAGFVKAAVPWLVTSPATSTLSLIATGTPSSGRSSPARTRALAWSASARAASWRTTLNAFSLGSSRSIRSRQASSSSRGVTSPARISSACRAAPAKARSDESTGGTLHRLDRVEIKWDQQGLAPCIVQDWNTGEVLTLAYMNAESLARTQETGETWFWSRSRGELWHKGATSGNVQKVRELRYDCDADALLALVEPTGPACHTGERTCFHNGVESLAPHEALPELERTIAARRGADTSCSYTAQLLADPPFIGAKVQEEAEEVARAAREETDERVREEAADLLYHLTVLLARAGSDDRRRLRRPEPAPSLTRLRFNSARCPRRQRRRPVAPAADPAALVPERAGRADARRRALGGRARARLRRRDRRDRHGPSVDDRRAGCGGSSSSPAPGRRRGSATSAGARPTSPLVAFTDDDTRAEPDWLEQLLAVAERVARRDRPGAARSPTRTRPR